MTRPSQNWKIELRYGRLVTPYKHFTAIADGVVGELDGGFECRPGPAVMSIKTWAADPEESAHMARIIGKQIGFTAAGRIEVFETDPGQAPGENPYGYDINLVAYDED